MAAASSADNGAAASSTQRQGQAQRTPAYWFRGGFSTSICEGLFAGHRHSDCCALTCCGVLLYDRNSYLMTGEKPSWNYRCLNFILLVAVFVCWIVSLVLGAPAKEEEDDGDEDDNHRKGGTRSRVPVREPAFKEPAKPEVNSNVQGVSYHLSAILFGVLVAMCFYFLLQAASQRFRLRRILMAKMYEQRTPSKGDQEAQEEEETHPDDTTPLVTTGRANVDTFLKLQEPYIRTPHYLCSCLPKDDIMMDPSNLPDKTVRDKKADLCHCLWRTLSFVCCGCCGCWLQLCGMCAIGQEDRELQHMLPVEKFQIDFISFQPWADYQHKLEELRQNEIKSMWKHFTTLSRLSKQLVQILAGVLGTLTLIAFSGLDPFFRPIHLVVVVMVLLQAFVILYFVHWFWNRFDLSFDAVVKYFASGFILGTTNAFIYEMLVSVTLSITGFIVKVVVFIIVAETGTLDREQETMGGAPVDDDVDDDVPDEEDKLHLAPIWLLVIVAFLNAFAVAAMVEEITKYFGFWMVEHPDLKIRGTGTTDNTTEITDATEEFPPITTSEPRTLKSVGAGITVAMVTTAMGFACCENFMYVFFYARPASPSTEIATLLARSIFPVHPLAAAMQSIGVCRRELEKDETMGFGWMLLPAVLLHGSFDFALMLLDLLYKRQAAAEQEESDDDANDNDSRRGTRDSDIPQPGSSADEVSLQQQLPALCFSVGIVVVGLVYYFCKARAQRRRLEELDKRRQQEGSEYEQLS